MFDLPIEHYEGNRKDVVAALAGALREGRLSLLLGSGCSSGMNLPSWHQMVNGMSAETKLNTPSGSNLIGTDIFDERSPAEDLFTRMESVRTVIGDDVKYVDRLRAQLYPEPATQIIGEPTNLLRALGAITIPSKRGSVREVISLNFDCLLEWYLSIHGVVSQVVTKWPSLLGDPDVTVYHPHGYIPIGPELGSKSDMVVFDSAEVDRQLSGQSAWRAVFEQLISSRFILAVGLGGRDYLLRSLLQKAVDEVRKLDKRPLGCWLCTPSVEPAIRQQLRARGFIIVPLKNRNESEELIFEVCREARRGTLIW